MDITLTPELESFVNRQVASGRFETAGELVREALQQFDESDQIGEQSIEEIRAKILEAELEYERGDFITINSEAESKEFVEDIIRRGHERLAAGKQR